jgi:hypothetical protein
VPHGADLDGPSAAGSDGSRYDQRYAMSPCAALFGLPA